MKNIGIVGNKLNYQMYKMIFCEIHELFNIETNITHIENETTCIEEYMLENDAIYIENSNLCQMKWNLPIYTDYIYKKKGYFLGNDNKLDSFELFLDIFDIKIQGSRIILLESNEWYRTIYQVLSEREAAKINIATINENSCLRLRRGDYCVKFSALERFNDIDLLINLSGIGDVYSLETSPLQNIHFNTKILLETIFLPLETSLIKQYKYKNKNSIYYSGLILGIINSLVMVNKVFDEDLEISKENILKIYKLIEKQIEKGDKDGNNQ